MTNRIVFDKEYLMTADEKHYIRSDEDLVSDYLKDDENAFSVLLDRYQKRLIAYIYPSVKNYHTAEDIALETLESAWQGLRRFDRQKSSFKTWLYLIADRRKIDKLRKKDREIETTTLIPEEIPITGDIVVDMQEIEPVSTNRVLSLVEDNDEVETNEIKQKCLSVLSDDERLLYQLKLEQGLTYKEILNNEPFRNLTEETLKQRLSRLKKTISKELSKYLPR
ncbi:MAG: RNA polymerase sigma factor [Planctomycetota bacterium]|nr:RNA polymerase sigma factor [Planctomycetota bacterium]